VNVFILSSSETALCGNKNGSRRSFRQNYMFFPELTVLDGASNGRQ
jgi:hypothetical protein